MVKKIINISILLLFIVKVITYTWPDDTAGLINTISFVIISVAAGIASISLWEDFKK